MRAKLPLKYGGHLGKGRVKVTILAKTFYAFLCGPDVVEPGVDQIQTLDGGRDDPSQNETIATAASVDQKGNTQRSTTHVGFSLTCLVNVRTLLTSPNCRARANSSCSEKCGGRPLI